MWGAGIVITAFGALIGIIWALLQSRIRTNYTDSMRAAVEAKQTAMQAQKEADDLRLKLAEEHYSRGEVRQVFTDLIAPISQQLGVIQGMLQTVVGRARTND